MANNSKNAAMTIDISDRPVMYKLADIWTRIIPPKFLRKICKNQMRFNRKKAALLEEIILILEDDIVTSSEKEGWLRRARKACSGLPPRKNLL